MCIILTCVIDWRNVFLRGCSNLNLQRTGERRPLLLTPGKDCLTLILKYHFFVHHTVDTWKEFCGLALLKVMRTGLKIEKKEFCWLALLKVMRTGLIMEKREFCGLALLNVKWTGLIMEKREFCGLALRAYNGEKGILWASSFKAYVNRAYNGENGIMYFLLKKVQQLEQILLFSKPECIKIFDHFYYEQYTNNWDSQFFEGFLCLF